MPQSCKERFLVPKKTEHRLLEQAAPVEDDLPNRIENVAEMEQG
jgi:hypothetical protein